MGAAEVMRLLVCRAGRGKPAMDYGFLRCRCEATLYRWPCAKSSCRRGWTVSVPSETTLHSCRPRATPPSNQRVDTNRCSVRRESGRLHSGTCSDRNRPAQSRTSTSEPVAASSQSVILGAGGDCAGRRSDHSCLGWEGDLAEERLRVSRRGLESGFAGSPRPGAVRKVAAPTPLPSSCSKIVSTYP